MADILANNDPVSCIPSPESTTNLITTSLASITLCCIIAKKVKESVLVFCKINKEKSISQLNYKNKVLFKTKKRQPCDCLSKICLQLFLLSLLLLSLKFFLKRFQCSGCRDLKSLACFRSKIYALFVIDVK